MMLIQQNFKTDQCISILLFHRREFSFSNYFYHTLTSYTECESRMSLSQSHIWTDVIWCVQGVQGYDEIWCVQGGVAIDWRGPLNLFNILDVELSRVFVGI